MKTLKLLGLLLITALFITSCSDDEPEVVNEEEVITTIKVELISGGNTITLLSKDSDGEGPNPPVVSVSGNLAAGTTYTGSIELLNETETPAEDVTEEIEEEDDEHQFFFIPSNGLVTTKYTDSDGDGNPIGLAFTLTTTNAGTSNFRVVLVHEPNKSGTGVSAGDITNAGGEQEVDVTFPIVIQ